MKSGRWSNEGHIGVRESTDHSKSADVCATDLVVLISQTSFSTTMMSGGLNDELNRRSRDR